MELRNRDRDATPFVTKDGSTIREYFHSDLQSLAEASLEPSTSTQRHYHARSEEIYLIVEGGGELEVDGDRREVGPGDAVLIPPGSRHRLDGWIRGRATALLLRSAVRRRRHLLRVGSSACPTAPISFARGAPAPELVPARGARGLRPRGGATGRRACLRVRPGRRLRARSGSGSRRGTASLRGASCSRSARPPGIRVLRRRAAGAPAWPRARRGAELRPPAQDPRARRGRDRRPRDGRGGPRSRRARARAAEPQRTRRPSSTRSRRSRTRAAARCRPSAAHGSSRSFASTSSRFSRTTRTASFASRATRSRACRARGRRARHVHVLVLEDGRARCSDGLLRPSRARRGRVRGACGLDVHLAAVPAAGHRLASSSAGAASSRTSSACARELRSRRDAMLDALSTHAPAGATLEPARGRLLRLARGRRRRTAAALAAAAEREGVAFIAGGGFFPASSGGGARAPASRTATRPRNGSREGIERIARAPRLSLGGARCGGRAAGRRGSPAAKPMPTQSRMRTSSEISAEKKTKLTSTCLRLRKMIRIA